MREVGAFEVKTQLSELLAAAESFLITRRGIPVVRLVPVRRIGDHAATVARLPALRVKVASRNISLGTVESLSARDDGRP